MNRKKIPVPAITSRRIMYFGITILILVALSAAACGNKDKNDSKEEGLSLKADILYDSKPEDSRLDNMVQKLIENNIFEGEVAKVNGTIVMESYGLNDGEGNAEIYASYMSTAAKADEITIIKTDNLKETETYIETYVETRKKSFESYMPEEVKKLDNILTIAYGKESGIYILCICSDKNAALKQIEAD